MPDTNDSESDLLVEIDSVTKQFGKKTVLQDVSWSLARGRISGLLGPNGAGKTTLFRLLMGILQADAGHLTIDGLDCFEDRVRVKRLVGFLPDEPVFYSYLSGREVLELSAGMHGLEVSDALARVETLVERLGMREALDQYADDYSRGMKKKLGLLLALIHEPPLLILDEPTNGLDVESTRLFFDLMREQAAKGTTIVFSTHLMDQVERLCRDAAIIAGGRLIISGSLNEIRAGRSLEEVFVELTQPTPK
ncbi:MAG: ABC transporter ATP-binding protein [Verrucomicrobiae bacterium]|nr:ABC transporter ATP-binding protein [Verrucomicrobiae bacterium]